VDAISVLEAARRTWGKPLSVSFRDDFDCLEQFVDNVDVETAVIAVRKAVQAGIINDLGSGSHVDLVIIQRDRVRQWRERLIKTNLKEQDDSNVEDVPLRVTPLRLRHRHQHQRNDEEMVQVKNVDFL